MKVILPITLVFAGALSFYFYHKEPSEPESRGLDGPHPRQAWFAMQRTSHSKKFDYVKLDAARLQTKLLLHSKHGGETAKWTFQGPANRGGRVTDIAGSSSDPNLFYVGAASGGVWKTTNGGSSYTPIFDGVGSLAIGALAVDPQDADVLYVGTGEANPGGGSVAYPGDGVWRTDDGGKTWRHLGLPKSHYIGGIEISPQSSNTVFVAVMGELYGQNPERGLYRSKDQGATWEKVLYIDDDTGVIDVSIDPSNPMRIFAASWQWSRDPGSRQYGGERSRLWFSEDGGSTWNILSDGLPGGELGRMGVAVSPADPQVVYLTATDATGYFKGFYRSRDGGRKFATINTTALSGAYSSYGWWFGRIFAHPTRVDEVWAVGISLHATDDGGRSFTARGLSTHADHHAVWFAPSPSERIVLGNDGGAYVSNSSGDFDQTPLPITQFYAVEADSQGRIVGGLQDNGTFLSPDGAPDNWRSIYGGDGFTARFDPNDSQTLYAEYQYGNLAVSTNNGRSFSPVHYGLLGRSNWHMPYSLSTQGSATVLYAGTHKLYRSTNKGQSWQTISGDLTNGDQGTNGVTYGTITSIDVSEADADVIWAGTDDGNVWVSKDSGGQFTKVSANLPGRWVTRVTASSHTPSDAYVSFSGFRNGESDAHVFVTHDYGLTWEAIVGNLPDSPVNDIIIDPNDANRLFAATDVGVFESHSQGIDWQPLAGGQMPPGLIITDLKIQNGNPTKLIAATYGRGIYSTEL